MLLINGEHATQINALDRGLSYGDGLFETLALIEGRPRLWHYHLQRLHHGCRRLSLALPDARLLEHELLTLQQQYKGIDKRRLVAKIVVTRGHGGRGYRPGGGEPTRIVAVFDWPDYPPEHRDGIRVRWCSNRLSLNPQLAGIKHLNRLDQVMASLEWDDEGIAEGLMLDQHGCVVEGTRTNLFLIRGQTLLTAPVDDCGIAGIIREIICTDAIGHHIPVEIRPLTIDDVIGADEVFVCNSIIGIWPVIQIIDDQHPAAFAVGPLTQTIRQRLQDYADASTVTSTVTSADNGAVTSGQVSHGQ